MRTFGTAQIVLLALIVAAVAPQAVIGREIDMRPHWNDRIALANPHKGWYHHYPDNHINKYIIREDAHLLDFPGIDHIYIRLAWAYLEPREGRFDWKIIDEIIDKWTAHGLKIAFRISCRETSTDRIEQQYATPKWVIDAGAKGAHWRRAEKTGPDGPWEPVFDDPVYLEKLENFLKAFGGRYDGKPWLRYVDIGSIGDWGEGHTSHGSQTKYGYAQRKRHVDLYCKYFRKTQVVATDDFVYVIEDPVEREKMHRYLLSKGVTYRDDSILVNYYIGAFPETFTVRSPEYFADVHRSRPTILELEHYGGVRRLGNWTGRPGSSLAQHGGGKSGADFFRGALELLHATYIGYHGFADVWLAENPELTVELLNRCGYWFFLHAVTVPDVLQSGKMHTIQLAWENRGVAPSYHPYTLKLRLAGPGTAEFTFDAGNHKWLPDPPGTVYRENHTLHIPAALPAGTYKLKIKLYAQDEKRDVRLALDPSLLDNQKYYTLGSVNVAKRKD